MSLVFHGKAPKVIADTGLNAVADDHIRPITRHYLAQMGRLQAKVSLPTIADLIKRDAPADAIIHALPFDQVFGSGVLGSKAAPQQTFQAFITAEFTSILTAAGVATTADMAAVIPAIGVMGPGVLAADSAAWAAMNSSRLISGVSGNTKNAIRAVLTSGIVANKTPQEIARDIQQIIGLRAPQAASMLKFGESLARAGVDPAVISTRLAQIKTGFLKNRGMVIARTETINAANGGQQLAWKGAQREGILTDENSSKAWIVTFDDLLDLVICAPMPDMDENQGLKIGDTFTTGIGHQVEFPTAHPNCRCAQGLVVLENS